MANIKTYLDNIKNALFGKDVRSSIYNGLNSMNEELENTTNRQIDLESTFDQLVINAGNSNAEIVDARVKSDGTSYSKLGDRLDIIDSQLADIENENLKKTGGVLSKQLYGSRENATLLCKSNTKSAYPPVTPNTIEGIVEYGGIDQAIDCNVFWTNDENGNYIGTKVDVISTTINSVTISGVNNTDLNEGSLIALYTTEPSKDNISYLGELKSISGNIIKVDKWISMETKNECTPSDVKYAVVGISTKMYVNYNYIRAREDNNWLTSVVGDQIEIRNASNASIVGSYVSLRQDENSKGGTAFRVGSQGEAKWTSAYDLNGKAKYLISTQSGSSVDEILHVNGENLINGDGSINRCWASSSASTPTPILTLTKDTNLSSINYNKNCAFMIRNNSSNDITLTSDESTFYCDGYKLTSFTLRKYSTINVTSNGSDVYWVNCGNLLKKATITSTTGDKGNISISATYSDNIILSAESLNYIVLVRKISDRYTIFVYNPTSAGLEPVKDAEITYTINYI